MNLITELRNVYQAQCEAESTPYRLGSALGRCDAEYEYWRRFQSKLWMCGERFRKANRFRRSIRCWH